MEQLESPSSPEQSLTPRTSLGSRIANIFAAPGDVFDELKHTPESAANWLVPVALSIVVGIVFSFVVFSQPNIQKEIRDAQEKALSDKVQQGKMTQEQMNQAMAAIDKFAGPSTFKIIGSIGAIFVTFGRLFWWAFVIWALGRWSLHTRFPYMKGAEVAGLALMISALAGIVALLLVLSLGKLSSGPSLALMIEHFDISKRSHVALAVLNPFNFWFVGVMALGLAKLTGVTYGKAAIRVFGCWLAWEVLLIAIGMGQMAM